MINKRLIPYVALGLAMMVIFLLVLTFGFTGSSSASDPTSLASTGSAGQFLPGAASSGPTDYPILDPGAGVDGNTAVPSVDDGVTTFPTPKIAGTPRPTNWKVVLEDDFSKPEKSNFREIRETGLTAKYYNGLYQIYINSGDNMGFVTKDAGAKNVMIEIDTKLVAGTRMNYYGLLCRLVDVNNYYFFAISNGGIYAIGKKVNGQISNLLQSDIMPSDSIKKETNSINRMKAICNGNDLHLYINNELVASVADSDLQTGTLFGLFASAAGDQNGANIYFDNLRLSTAK